MDVYWRRAPMKEHKDRLPLVADLLMDAAHADRHLAGDEKATVRKLLREIMGIGNGPLPIDLDFRIDEFSPSAFDLTKTAAAFAGDSAGAEAAVAGAVRGRTCCRRRARSRRGRAPAPRGRRDRSLARPVPGSRRRHPRGRREHRGRSRGPRAAAPRVVAAATAAPTCDVRAQRAGRRGLRLDHLVTQEGFDSTACWSYRSKTESRFTL